MIPLAQRGSGRGLRVAPTPVGVVASPAVLLPAAGRMVTPAIRLVRELGVGGMGHVWLAEHSALGVRVAVKFLAPELARDRAAIARFSREAVAASEVRSPHVVEILDHGVSDELPPYIVMELLDGCDLAQLLARRGALPAELIMHVGGQVADALARAHERGVVHRDVKPGNIFLLEPDAERPFVKVLDFGIAKMDSPGTARTATGTALGTVHYMSPEQIVAGPLDHRTDVWSLGVVVFEMLTGTLPFDAASPGGLALSVHTQPFPEPSRRAPDRGTAFDAFVLRACARAPEDRFGSMSELATALAAIAVDRGPAHVVRIDADARAELATVAKRALRPADARSAQCILPAPEPLVPLRAIRSTAISASLRALEARGLLDAYFRELPSEHHAMIQSLVVGEWLEVERARHHYAALDRLGLSPLEMVGIGRSLLDKLHGSFLAALMSRLAATSIVTPWTVFKLLPRAWARVFDGGGIAVWKLGEKDARLEAHGFAIARYDYVRHALRGHVIAALDVMLKAKTHVQLVPSLTDDDTVAYRVAWA